MAQVFVLVLSSHAVTFPALAEPTAKVVATTSAAQQASDRLAQFQHHTQSLSGHFTQHLLEGNGLVDEAPRSGQFWVERPDKIRWQYEQPYEQLIVADGYKVWLFDPDLEQVLVRDLVPDSDDVAGLLLGSSANISQRFTITAINQDQFLLVPRVSESAPPSAIEQVLVEFDQQLIVSLELRDTLGASSRFEFTRLQANPAIDPAQFEFIPPDGVDVVIQQPP